MNNLSTEDFFFATGFFFSSAPLMSKIIEHPYICFFFPKAKLASLGASLWTDSIPNLANYKTYTD